MAFSQNKIQVVAVLITAAVVGIGVPLYSRLKGSDTQASLLQSGNGASADSTPNPAAIPPLLLAVSTPEPFANQTPVQLLRCTAQPPTVNPGEGVTWTVQNVNPPDKNSDLYIWSGAVSGLGQTMNSSYDVPGTYIANVKSSNGGQNSQTATCMVSVIPKSVQEPVIIAAMPSSSDTQQTQQFINPEVPVITEQTVTPSPVFPPVVTPEPAPAPAPAASKCPGLNYPSDIENNWAKNFIMQAYDECIFSGYHDGTFQPDAPISRAQAVKAILIAAGIPPKLGCYTTNCGTPFNDLAIWESQWLRAAWDLKIVAGATKDTFDPESPLSRGDAAILIAKTFKISPHADCFTANCGAGHPYDFFLDVTDIVQGSYLRALWDMHLIQGTAPNMFEPSRAITRAEMAVLLIKTSTLLKPINL